MKRGFFLLEAMLALALVVGMLPSLMSMMTGMNTFVMSLMTFTLNQQERLALKTTLNYESMMIKKLILTGETLWVETNEGAVMDYGVSSSRLYRRKQGGNRQYLTRRMDIESVYFSQEGHGGIVCVLTLTSKENLIWELLAPNLNGI